MLEDIENLCETGFEFDRSIEEISDWVVHNVL